MSDGASTRRPWRRMVKFILLLVFLGAIALFGIHTALKWLYPVEYEDEVAAYSRQFNVDPLLVTAMIKVESAFDPDAVSRSGARGLMQIMPDTGEWVAGQMGMESFDINRLFDPETNIQIGVWYFASLRRQFNDNVVLALAAYNGGRGNVAQWIDRDIWSGEEEDLEDIPFPETRAYVRKVLTAYEWYDRIWRSQWPLVDSAR